LGVCCTGMFTHIHAWVCAAVFKCGKPIRHCCISLSTPFCAGVVMGLAWTALGGSTLYVEAASVEKGEGKGSLKATGRRTVVQPGFVL